MSDAGPSVIYLSSVQTRSLVRNVFRSLLGLEEYLQSGHFVDSHLTRIIEGYSDWIEYHKGDLELKGHKKYINGMAVSHNGRFLYSCSSDETIIQWDLLTDKLFQQWKAHETHVRSLDLSGHILVSGCSSGIIRVWNVRDSKSELRHTLSQHTDWVRELTIERKNREWFVSCSRDRTMRVWSVRLGECLRVLEGHSGVVNDAILLYDADAASARILSSSADLSLRVWDHQSGECIQIINDTRLIPKTANCLSLSCDGSSLACAHGFPCVIVYQWPSLIKVKQIDETSLEVCFHPKKPNLLAIGMINSSVKVFDLHSGECVMHRRFNSSGIGNILCFSPDGSRLFSVSYFYAVRVWDTSDL